MQAHELIDILKDYPPETEVELAIVCPVEGDEPVAVDRYSIEGVLPWDDSEDDDDDDDATDDDEKLVIWLVGGEDDDVDVFMDAIEPDEGDHEHNGDS